MLQRYTAGTVTPQGRPRSVPRGNVVRAGSYTWNTAANLAALNRRQAEADREAHWASKNGDAAHFTAAVQLMKKAYQNERRPAKLQHYLQVMKQLVENKKAYTQAYRRLGAAPSFKLLTGVRATRSSSVSGPRLEVDVGNRRGRFRPNAKQWWALG